MSAHATLLRAVGLEKHFVVPRPFSMKTVFATPPPRIDVEGQRVSIRSDVPGASLGYRIDADRWRLYTAPVDAAPGATVHAKAVRYGWDESGVVRAEIADE